MAHLEALAAQEHAEDRTRLARMCHALAAELALDTARRAPRGALSDDDGTAAAVGTALAELRRDLDGGRIDRAAARVRLRRLVAVAGAVRGRDHAQSPAADPTRPAAESDSWDYRRDRHREGARSEARWVDTVLRRAGDPEGRRQPAEAPDESSAPPADEPTALLTSCGMAALTTVIGLLERHTGDGPIVVDGATYHETRHILATGALAGRVREVASDGLPAAIADLNAAAVVVDAVANSVDVRVADLPTLSAALDRVATRRRASGRPAPLLVVDASVCSMAAAPVQSLLVPSDGHGSAPGHRTVVVESLTKHAQLGLDRVAAGVMVTTGTDVRILDTLREHLGTNIADLTCLQLLPPDLELLGARLERVGRNAELLAGRLADAGLPVTHPSRPDHPDHLRWEVERPSCGLVTLADHACPPDLLDRWLGRARARGIALDHGAGFGFDTTRVYRTSATVAEASSFVRIAPGTEPIDAILAVADVLVAGWR